MQRTPGRQTISSGERNIARENAVVIACLEAGDIARMDCHESQFAAFATHLDLTA